MEGVKFVHDTFLTVYDQCFDDVYRYVYFKVGNKWDADDIVSEVFAKAFQGFDALKGDARPWVFKIAHHAVVDFYRAKGREVPAPSLNAIFDGPESDAVDSEAETACLKLALQQLDSEQRELINLRYFAGLRHAQVAEALKMTAGAVKMRISRLLEQVRGMVEQCLM